MSERLAWIHMPEGDGVELRPGERLVIGRAEGCHIRIKSSRISRQHAELHWDETKPVPFVVDMGSQNGSTLDGKELQAFHPEPLRDGVSIHVADFRVRVEIFGSTDPASTSSFLNENPTGVSVFWGNNDLTIEGTLGVDLALREVFSLIESRRLSGTLSVDKAGHVTLAVFCLGRLFDARSPTSSGSEAILDLKRAAGAKVSFSPEFEPTSKAFDLRATDVLMGKQSSPENKRSDSTERWDRP